MTDKNTNNALTSNEQKSFVVQCPSCGVSLNVPAKDAVLTCPSCQCVLSVTRKTRYVNPNKKEKTKLNLREFLDKIHFEKWKAWIYLLPAIVLLLIFTVYPIFNTVGTAFVDDYTGKLGFGNFTMVLTDPNFTTAIKNTLLLGLITVPLSTFLALLIAVCLNAIKPLQKLFQTIFFLPYVTNSIAIGLVFAALFDVVGVFDQPNNVESWGFINNLLGKFGVEPINWLDNINEDAASYWTKMTVLIIYIVWNALPFKILVLLGGLQSVNKQYYEAAMIDSTPRWRVFTRITVPLLSPMIAYVVITGFIGSFKEYTSIVGIWDTNMAHGQLYTMVAFIYDALPDDFYGQASAAALILFVIIFIVTMINLHVSKKKTHY